MPSFDAAVVRFVNRFAGESTSFDSAVFLLQGNHLLKGSLLVAALWLLWGGAADSPRRMRVITTLLACFIAMAFARGLALVLPYRARPMHEPGLSFKLPHEQLSGALEGWSSMPSDHAALYMALAAGIWTISRPIGTLALLWAALMICLPRLYLGLHYPSDLAAGAAIGIASVWLCTRPALERQLAAPMLAWRSAQPGLFLAVMFLVTLQIATVFESARHAGGAAAKFAGRLVGG